MGSRENDPCSSLVGFLSEGWMPSYCSWSCQRDLHFMYLAGIPIPILFPTKAMLHQTSNPCIQKLVCILKCPQ
jgi:hypothetical protein